MTGCLSCLPLPRSPPSGRGSPCACVKRFAKGQKSSPCSWVLTAGARAAVCPECNLHWHWLQSPDQTWVLFFSPLSFSFVALVLCQGSLVLVFPGLSLQGVCLVLELAASSVGEPSLGDCDALAWGFQHGAWFCWDSVSREGRKWEAGQDLTFIEHFAWGFVTFIQMLHVWDKNTFNYEFSFWPLEVPGDNNRPLTATSSRDQSSYIFAHQCLISAAQKSPWELTFCVRSTSCKAGMCCSWWESRGGGVCLEPRGDKILVSSKFWQITECKWFTLKCVWMVPGLPFHVLLCPFPRVILAKQRKCPNPVTLLFSLGYKWGLDTLCILLLKGGKKKVASA